MYICSVNNLNPKHYAMENPVVKRIVKFYLPSLFFIFASGAAAYYFLYMTDGKRALSYAVLSGLFGLVLLVNVFINRKVLNKILGSVAFLASLSMLVYWFVMLVRQSVTGMFRIFLLIVFSIVMAIFLLNYDKADEQKVQKVKKSKR